MTWKQYVGIAAAALVLFGAGVGAGRFGLPAKLELKEREIHHKVMETTINQKLDIEALTKTIQDIVNKAVQDITKKNNVVRTREVIRTPDGGVVERETETDRTETASHTATETTSHTATETALKEALATNIHLLDENLKLHELVKTTTYNTQRWAFDAMLGYHLPSLWQNDPGFNIIPLRGVVAGLQVSRKLLGPLWGGVWVTSTGATGISVRLVP